MDTNDALSFADEVLALALSPRADATGKVDAIVARAQAFKRDFEGHRSPPLGTSDSEPAEGDEAASSAEQPNARSDGDDA